MRAIYVCPRNKDHSWPILDDGNPKLCPKCKAEDDVNVQLVRQAFIVDEKPKA